MDITKPTFLTGGDISLLPIMEREGRSYRHNGATRDLLSIFRLVGCNCMRIRLWVNPSGDDVFVSDLAYTTVLAKRIKDAGFQLILAMQYSDTWANPGVQAKPAAWNGLTFEQLIAQVEEYTSNVISSLRDAGALPDIVQLGNEITDGMLWPEGKTLGNAKGYSNLAALLNAGIRGVERGKRDLPMPKIMVHVDRGGDWHGAEGFFDDLTSHNVRFDLIGLTFFPFLHGPLTYLKATLDNAALKYGKPLIVVETMYPYHGIWDQMGMTYPPSAEGQRNYMADLVTAVQTVPNKLGQGIIYWSPEWEETAGLRSSWTGRTLFDRKGNSLPGLDILGQAARKLPPTVARSVE